MAEDPLVADRAGFFRAVAWRFTPGAQVAILAPITELAEDRAAELWAARDDLLVKGIFSPPSRPKSALAARYRYLKSFGAAR